MKEKLAVLLLATICTIVVSKNQETEQVSPLVISDSIPVDTVNIISDTSKKYSFKAENVGLTSALQMFALSNGFSLDMNFENLDTISVNFDKITLDNAMNVMLKEKRLSWSRNGNMITIKPIVLSEVITKNKVTDKISEVLTVTKVSGTRIFTINYPRLKRSGQGSSSASFSSSASGQAGSVQLSTGDDIFFWQELEEQLKNMVSPDAKLIINRMAGVVSVTDTDASLDALQQYLEIVVSAATRQVEITARIYEVTLNKDNSLGVNWSKIAATLTEDGYTGIVNAATKLVIDNPDYNAATLSLDASFDNNINMIIDALKEQGEVRTVSQPRVVTINNQPALVKVGTDMPFFSANVTVNPTTSVREVQEAVRVITVGVVLSVTPQISGDGWVTLGIDPIISDLVSTEMSQNGSTAPVVDVKQSSALVRLRDRQTVRISGLSQTKKNVIERKVPLLGDIPLLKYLFKWKYTREVKKELIIFITPRIL
jgi:MSHA type pilus biogenesis protein MshL